MGKRATEVADYVSYIGPLNDHLWQTLIDSFRLRMIMIPLILLRVCQDKGFSKPLSLTGATRPATLSRQPTRRCIFLIQNRRCGS